MSFLKLIVWFLILMFTSLSGNAQKIKIEFISVSSTYNTGENWEGHRWNVYINDNMVKCYEKNNQGGVTYKKSFFYELNNNPDNNQFDSFTIWFDGWEHHGGWSNSNNSCKHDSKDRGYSKSTKHTIDFGTFNKTSTWSDEITISADQGRNLIFKRYYTPKLNPLSIVGSPACPGKTVTLTANVTPPDYDYKADWQYHVTGDVQISTIPNPAYCGPCVGNAADVGLDRPALKASPTLRPPPDDGGGWGEPCCNVPEMMTTTTPIWRPLASNTGKSYEIESDRLYHEIKAHHKGNGATTVQVRYRVNYNGEASPYYIGGSIQINPPLEVPLLLSKEDPICKGKKGEIHLTVEEGSVISDYLKVNWKIENSNDPPWETNVKLLPSRRSPNYYVIENLNTGTYEVTYKYSNNGINNSCISDPITRTLVDPGYDTLSATLATTHATSLAGKGSIQLSGVTGGKGDKSYSISPSATLEGIENGMRFLNLTPNRLYTITIEDEYRCERKVFPPIFIGPKRISGTPTTTPAECNGDSNGTFTINIEDYVQNGKLQYKITGKEVKNASNQKSTSHTFSHLAAGDYQAWAKDNEYGEDVQWQKIGEPKTVGQPNVLTIRATPTHITCNGANNGQIGFSITGGNTAFVYEISPNVGSLRGTTYSNLPPGSYTVSVEDSKGCEASSTNVIIEQTSGLTATVTINNLSCFEEGNGTLEISSLQGGNESNVRLALLNKDGSNFYEHTNKTIPSSGHFTFSGLDAGSYKVEMENITASGCNKSTTVQYAITQPAEIIFSSVTFTNASCVGANDGTIIPIMQEGNEGITFFTKKIGESNFKPLINLDEGTYLLRANKGSCLKEYRQLITIDEPVQALGFNWTSDDFDGNFHIPCLSGRTGITLSAFGGWDNYEFAKDGGTYSSSPYFEELRANIDYEFSIRDDAKCIYSQVINLEAPPSITATFTITRINCYGKSTGAVNIAASGGLGNYEYKLNGGNGTPKATFENLRAGDYSISISDGACSPSFDINIPQNDSLKIEFAISQIDCYGAEDGSITTDITGGVAPYTLVWNTSATSSSLIDLKPGVYSLDITDAKGCISDKLTEIEQPDAPLSFDFTATNVTCKGESNGMLVLEANGGTPPYDYSIDDGNIYSNTTNWSDLPPNTYQIKIKDSNGCATLLQEAIISEPPVLAIALVLKKDILCNGERGLVNVMGSGGTEPYTYAIDGGIFESNKGVFDNLRTGTHTIYIKDANKCIKRISVSLTQPDLPLEASFELTKVSCFNGVNGAISAIITGGVIPYEITWDGSEETTAEITGLSAGAYIIHIIDANDCKLDQEVRVEEPAYALSATYELTQVSCNNLMNGGVNINAMGGYGNYQYSLNDAPFSLVSAYTNLGASNYHIKVKDEEGCIYSEDFEIAEPDVFTGNLSVSSHVACFLGENGAVSMMATGGTPPYSYSLINSGIYQSDYSFDTLSSGTYKVVAQDANGCSTFSNEVIVSQPTILIASISDVLHASCNKYNGEAQINVSGGISPYSYQWQHNIEGVLSTSEHPTNLKAGLYEIKVTDANDCQLTEITQTINDEDGPTAIIDSFLDATCFGGADGHASVLAAGGSGNYTYSWSNGEKGSEASHLSSGKQYVEVVDERGCLFIAEVTIGFPKQLQGEVISSNQPLCFDSCEGEITVSAFGGVAPYTYTWEQNISNNGSTATLLCAGSYLVIIRDANNCEYKQTIELLAPEPLSISIIDKIEPSCNEFSDGSIHILVEGGVSDYQYIWQGISSETESRILNLSASTYNVTVIDDNGCSFSKQMGLSEPPPLEIYLGDDLTLCANQEYSIDATIDGGTYQWFKDDVNIGTNQTVATTGTGRYKVNLIDESGCPANDEIFINQISNSLETAFLGATEIEVGDSLQLVDISWEIPDNLSWDFGTGVNIIDDNLWSPIIQYDEAGTYQIKLTAYLNGCVDSLTKEITLLEATEKSNSGRFAIIKGIKEVSVFPNPTDGKFAIHIELYNKEELVLIVYDLQGNILNRKFYGEAIYFRKEYDLTARKQGVYLVQVITSSEEKLIRIFIK